MRITLVFAPDRATFERWKQSQPFDTSNHRYCTAQTPVTGLGEGSADLLFLHYPIAEEQEVLSLRFPNWKSVCCSQLEG